jgi:6-phosphogluconolactonase
MELSVNRFNKILPLVSGFALGACSGGGMNGASAPYASIASVSTPSSQSSGSSGGFTIGGTVSGLSGSGLTLRLNGAGDLQIAGDGTFAFSTALASGDAYLVTASAQPTAAHEICVVSNNSGAVAQANVTNISIDCSTILGFLYQITQGNSLLAPGQIDFYAISSTTGLPTAVGSTPQTGSAPSDYLMAGPGGKFVYALAGGSPEGPLPLPQSPSSISTYAVDSTSGALTPVGTPISAGDEPEAWTLARSGFLFVLDANDSSGQNSTPIWTLAEYSLDSQSGTPTLIGTVLTLPENTVTSIAVTTDGRFLYVMNGAQQTPQSLTAYAIDSSTGHLTQGPAITVDANAQTPTLDPLGRFLYLIDATPDSIPLTATLLSYSIDSTSGALTPNGAGPQISTNGSSLSPDPTGRYLYASGYPLFGSGNSPSGTLQAFDVSGAGTINAIGSAAEPDSANLTLCDPSGRFVYAVDSNLMIDTFAVGTQLGGAGQLTPSGSIPASAGSFVIIE